MDIHHKHAPIKNWREFTKEIGIIVIGIAIALSGEQAIEAIHHRSEVRETREALKEEMGWNIASLNQSLDRSKCGLARLDEIEKWLQSVENGRSINLVRSIAVPGAFVIHTSVWQVTAGDAVARMPLEERMSYAELYDLVGAVDDNRSRATELWIDLANSLHARRLSDDKLLAIEGDISGIRRLNTTMHSASEFAASNAAKLGIGAGKLPDLALDRQARADECQPLLAS